MKRKRINYRAPAIKKIDPACKIFLALFFLRHLISLLPFVFTCLHIL